MRYQILAMAILGLALSCLAAPIEEERSILSDLGTDLGNLGLDLKSILGSVSLTSYTVTSLLNSLVGVLSTVLGPLLSTLTGSLQTATSSLVSNAGNIASVTANAGTSFTQTEISQLTNDVNMLIAIINNATTVINAVAANQNNGLTSSVFSSTSALQAAIPPIVTPVLQLVGNATCTNCPSSALKSLTNAATTATLDLGNLVGITVPSS